jgi:hypothetical protein
VCVVGKPQHGDKDLGGARGACVPIFDRHRLRGIVDEELIAGCVLDLPRFGGQFIALVS